MKGADDEVGWVRLEVANDDMAEPVTDDSIIVIYELGSDEDV